MQSLETKSSRPRPKFFETETRPETFETETETSKNGSRDASRDRDQVSRLHHCWMLTKRTTSKVINYNILNPFAAWKACLKFQYHLLKISPTNPDNQLYLKLFSSAAHWKCSRKEVLFYSLWNATSGLRRSSPLALRSGSRGYFRSECCTGGKSMKCMNTKMTERLSDKDVLPIFLARKMSISTLIYRSAGNAVTFLWVRIFRNCVVRKNALTNLLRKDMMRDTYEAHINHLA